MKSDKIGRLTAKEMENVMFDAPNMTVRAMLTQLDAIVDAMKATDPTGAIPEVAALKKLELNQ